MKKIICIVIAFILSVSIASCSNETAQENVTEQSIEQSSEQTTQKEISVTDAKKYLEDNYNKVNIDGSTSMIPLHQSLNDLFDSDKEKSVEHSKTVDAFEKLISGENDILFGVDYSDELLEKAKNSGIELVKKEITREAFVFLINVNNPVKSLTIEQIKDIYSGKITNWSEVGGDDAPVKAFQRNSDSGSQMRMVKFMGDVKLMENDVEYVSSMYYVIEQIENYDKGKYSIAYNMYTFTENQYPNENVILLSVDGVYPDDESVFDETYPLVIYNYIYYDENNTLASEFANNLYAYLMSDEGQKLISDSGYVNLNTNLDRNRDIDSAYDWDIKYGRSDIGFYNKAKGEYYDIKYNSDGKNDLLIFYSFNEYVLRDSKYKDNMKANDFLTAVFNSDIPKNPNTAGLYEEGGMIKLNPYFDATLDPEDFFVYKYDGMYYSYLTYFIEEDKYVLRAMEKDSFDIYTEHDYLTDYSSYTSNFAPDSTVEFKKEELKDLYMRESFYDIKTENGVEIDFFQPFA